MKKAVTFFAITFSVVFFSLTANSKDLLKEIAQKAEADFSAYVNMTKTVGSKEIKIYEGLPHQGFEYELFQQEKSKNNVIKINDFPFYGHPLKLGETDVKDIFSIITNPKNFARYRGPKLCGGFHPDYNITLFVDIEKVNFQICFGCNEMQIIAENKELIVELKPETYDAIKPLLVKYQKHRPKSKLLSIKNSSF